ncbi:hypothetical protein ONS96_014939 [Cadophora gregata f. sp. sojae]|nr:hypothetical protein ONS96_014939 [Cadophora gregata f. sp. sojae]
MSVFDLGDFNSAMQVSYHSHFCYRYQSMVISRRMKWKIPLFIVVQNILEPTVAGSTTSNRNEIWAWQVTRLQQSKRNAGGQETTSRCDPQQDPSLRILRHIPTQKTGTRSGTADSHWNTSIDK